MDVAGLCVIVGDELGHENGCHGTQENGVAAEESKELCGRCEDFPLQLWSAGATVALQKGRPTYWNKGPATNDGSKQLTTADVDVLGAE
jgi:hypothetical protein